MYFLLISCKHFSYFLSKIIVAFLSALSKSDLQGNLTLACANLLYVKRVLFSYIHVVYDNRSNAFPSLYIKSNIQRNVIDYLFVMTCGETDKASLSILIFFQRRKPMMFSFTENRLSP